MTFCDRPIYVLLENPDSAVEVVHIGENPFRRLHPRMSDDHDTRLMAKISVF